jgi:hypothetical protein
MTPKVDDSMNVNLQNIKKEIPPTMTTTAQVPELASKRQIRGAAWAGGIAGLCVGGPIGAVLLCWGGMHLAKKNDGDAGDFCRKAGDFTFRMGDSIKREWKEAHPKHSEAQVHMQGEAKHLS